MVCWEETFFAKLGHGGPLLALWDAVPGVCFYAKDGEGRFVAVNGALAEMLGVERSADLLGRTGGELDEPELARAHLEEDAAVKRPGEAVRKEIWWLPNLRTGDAGWYCRTRMVLRSATGEVLGVAGVMRPLEGMRELSGEHQLMTQVGRHIERHFGDRLTLKDLAGRVKLSERQFQRVFSRTFRATLSEHLLRVRIRAAAKRLEETRDSLAEIATDCGFCDQAHLTNQFRRFRGVTPAEYRRRHLDGNSRPRKEPAR